MEIDSEIEDAARKAMDPAGMDVIGNEALYRLCREYPLHDNPDAVGAKIWLIGRSYAAAIERRRKYLDELSDDFYARRVIPGIQGSGIDTLLVKLRAEDSITETNIPFILRVHKHLLETFKKITGLEKRSLASKYLHFHFPHLFFIYDSRANSSLTRISKSAKRFSAVINDSSVDFEYASFFCRAFLRRKDVEGVIGKAMSPREFDNMLILLENDVLRKRMAAKRQQSP